MSFEQSGGTEASGYSLLFGWIMDLLKINPL